VVSKTATRGSTPRSPAWLHRPDAGSWSWITTDWPPRAKCRRRPVETGGHGAKLALELAPARCRRLGERSLARDPGLTGVLSCRQVKPFGRLCHPPRGWELLAHAGESLCGGLGGTSRHRYDRRMGEGGSEGRDRIVSGRFASACESKARAGESLPRGSSATSTSSARSIA
jgi:hypothetical protein